MPCCAYAAPMDDDQIIAQRIAGKSVRAIAKAADISADEVNEAIDHWADQAIDDKIRKNTLALDLARLDELQEVFYGSSLARRRGVWRISLKLIARRCVMLGLAPPQMAELQIVDSATPKNNVRSDPTGDPRIDGPSRTAATTTQ